MAKKRIPYKDWTQAQKDEYKRRYQAKHRHDPEEVHRYNLACRHGILKSDYDAMHKAQNGLCAICGRPEVAKSTSKRGGIKRLSVDHCHQEGQIRGLLCVRCNTGIGVFDDSVKRLRAAIDYIQSR